MRARRFCTSCVFAAVAAVVAAGCEEGGASGKTTATAEIHQLAGSGVDGTAEFTKLPSGRVRVVVDLTGLVPGPHGVHIHQYGDCSDPNGLLAGDHFNPDAVEHGGPSSAMHHAGDLGNVNADNNGRGYLSIETGDFALDRGARGVLGRSVIVHATRDDLTSQPAGMSGDRIACGVIRADTGTTEPVTPDEES